MDQELIAYLDERFRETSRQIESFREETNQRFERIDARFEQIDVRFGQVDARFDRLEERVHQTQIVVENMQDSIRMLAEGVFAMGERLDGFQVEVRHEFQGLNKRLTLLEAHAANEGREKIEILRERYKTKTL